MRTLLTITAGAVATAALMVLCDTRPGLPLSAKATPDAQAGDVRSRRWDDDELNAVLTCNCNASAGDRFDAGCFLWCPLDFDADGASNDE